MPAKLFGLRGVEEDEADDIRQLLDEHHIEYYETPAGNWGISMPAIWINDEGDLSRAQGLIDSYQRERAERVQRDYQEQLALGQQRRFLDIIRENPLRVFLYLAFIALILYVSIRPFLALGE